MSTFLIGTPDFTDLSKVASILRRRTEAHEVFIEDSLYGEANAERRAFEVDGDKFLNTPGYRERVAQSAKLDFVRRIKDLAGQGLGLSVTAMGPFLDLDQEIEGQPLFPDLTERLKHPLNLRILLLILCPEPDNDKVIPLKDLNESEKWLPIEKEVKRRIRKSGQGDKIQQALNLKTSIERYYREQAELILRSHKKYKTHGVKLMKIGIDEKPEQVAARIACVSWIHNWWQIPQIIRQGHPIWTP